ncbi:MAG: hypothetical protein HY961_07055 [Ignavibacteriae bacterium]|nr:hypothetical protein [Ignavibacteriota bacterium]
MVALLAGPCEESLPPRNEPKDFLQTSLDVRQGIVIIRGGSTEGSFGSFDIQVKSTYSEVLQGDEHIQAKVSVWPKSFPEQKGEVIAARRELQNPGIIYAGKLTLEPNGIAYLLKQGSHRTSEGKGFWEFVRLTRRVNSRGEVYFESDPVNLVATGTVQIFKNVQSEKLPQIQFSFVYYVYQ